MRPKTAATAANYLIAALVLLSPALPASALSLAADKQDWLEAATEIKGQTVILDDYNVNVTSVSGTDAEVIMYVKAWDAYGDPVGFGPDGSVETERFRFIGGLPQYVIDYSALPKMTDDGEGTLFPKYPEVYDPQLALRQQLEHTISLVAKPGDSIVPGKVGNTVTTVYPDADPESSSVDGTSYHYLANQTWATIHDGAGNATVDDSVTTALSQIYAGTSASTWSNIRRSFWFFDTSAIADGDTIDSAVLSFYGESKNDGLSASPTYNVVSTTSSSTTATANADYATCESTKLSDSDISYSSFSTSGYNDFTLNSAGISEIDKTGLSRFCSLETTYDLADSAPSWSNGAYSQVKAYTADNGSNKPKLVVNHHTPGTCGDGWIDGGEACDDGDTDNGDGCSSTCTVESGWSCEGEPSVCTEDEEPAATEWTIPDSPTSYDAVAVAAWLSCLVVFVLTAFLKL